MAFALAGCQSNEEDTETSEETTSIDINDHVTDYCYGEGEYTDSSGNEYSYSYIVPEITDDTDGAKEINESIREETESIAEEGLSSVESKTSLICTKIFWEGFTYDNIAGIVIHEQIDWTNTDYYLVYNYDLENESALTNADLIEKLGVSEDELLDAAATAIRDKFSELNDDNKNMDEYDFAYEYNEDIINELTIDNIRFYANESGDLYICTEVAALAGAESYEYEIPLNITAVQ